MTRRAQLILVDDPNFVPDFVLPAFDFDDNGELLLRGLDFSQGKVSSQFSPVTNSSASANRPFIDLNIRHSSSQASVNFESPFDKQNQSQNDNSMIAFGEEEELPWGDFPLRIDAEGNIFEEPELPAHPVEDDPFGELDGPGQKAPSGAHLPDDDGPVIFGDDDAEMNFGDDEQQQQHQFPVIDPAEHVAQNSNDVPLPSEEDLSSDLGDVPQQPQRRQRKIKRMAPDSATHVSRSELKGWLNNYMTHIEDAQHVQKQVTVTQAKKNAYNLVFGLGLGEIGALSAVHGVEHELSEFFAGDNLKDMLMDNMAEGADDEALAEEGRGGARRRSASVAFGSEGNQSQDGRRIRPRTDGEEEGEQELPRSQQDAQIDNDGMMAFGSDPPDMLPEAGREHPGSALSDHRRSSNAPWNRHSSVEVGRNAVEGSPQIGRGSILHSNVKYSDDGAPAFGSDGFAPLQYDGAADVSSFDDFGAAAGVSTQEANTSQFMREALDREGRNFLGFVEGVAAQRGEEDAENVALRWVEFDGLFEEQDKTRAVVAQAFLHILALATKGQVKVKQEGLEKYEPFGEIRVGITATAAAAAVHEEYHSAEEELHDEDGGESGDGGEGEEMEGLEFEDAEEEQDAE